MCGKRNVGPVTWVLQRIVYGMCAWAVLLRKWVLVVVAAKYGIGCIPAGPDPGKGSLAHPASNQWQSDLLVC